jgi:putative hemolysin
VFELLIVAFLILLNGIFALSELAVVSSRRVRLKSMAESGRSGAKRALALNENPGRFLSTVQIGITLVGVLAGAFSGVALGGYVTDWLLGLGVERWLAEPLGFGGVISVITFLSVVIGELVPKQFALREPENIACLVAPPMYLLSKVTTPVVWFLDASTRGILFLLGLRASPESSVTEEEIKTIVAEAAHSGVIEADERAMISGVLRLSDRSARAIMTPRSDVEWLDVTLSDADMLKRLENAKHARLPACEGSQEAVIGVIQVRDLIPALISKKPLKIRDHVHDVAMIPDVVDALDVLKHLRDAAVPIALVHDEYGHFEGVVTPADILDAIAGSFRADEDNDEPEAVERADGSWLISGWMPVDEMADLIRLKLPERRSYDTAAGFLIDQLQRLPSTGDLVDSLGFRFEVVDMDGRRVDKLLVKRLGNDGGDDG